MYSSEHRAHSNSLAHFYHVQTQNCSLSRLARPYDIQDCHFLLSGELIVANITPVN